MVRSRALVGRANGRLPGRFAGRSRVVPSPPLPIATLSG